MDEVLMRTFSRISADPKNTGVVQTPSTETDFLHIADARVGTAKPGGVTKDFEI
jgi:hypothetical protein